MSLEDNWPAAGQGEFPSSLHSSGYALVRAEQAAYNEAIDGLAKKLDLTWKA